MKTRTRSLYLLGLLTFVFSSCWLNPTSARGDAAGTVLEPAAAQVDDLLADLTRKGPYLIFPGDPTRMQVLWQLSATSNSTIEWGTDDTYSMGSAQTTEYGADHQHRYTITGLTPGMRCQYRVTTQGASRTGSFTAAPDPEATQLKFVAYGDTRTYPANHNQVADGIVSTFTADPGYQTFALVVGDLVANGNYESDWTAQFFNPSYPDIQAMLAGLPYHSCMGNHEGTGALFTKYFPYPFVGARYWSFDYGPAHFVIMDQMSSYGAGSAQLQWIASDLAASDKLWKFVCLHEPGWSAGGGHGNNAAVQTLIQPLCEQYGVSIVFAGHNHYYARAFVNNVTHVTAGGGGAPLHTPNLSYPNVVAASASYSFCKIAIDGGLLTMTAITPQGTVIDSFAIVMPDVTEPTVALATPNGGERWVVGTTHDITWTATDDREVASVGLAYSLDGGATFPHLIASGLANSGSYSWTIPDAPTAMARVRIAAHDAAGNLGMDASDTNFTIDTYTLAVSVNGSGTVTRTPDLLGYVHGTPVQLVATPAPGWVFSGWGGDASGTDSVITIVMDDDKSVTATFALWIGFRFKPHSLNLKSKGKWTTGYLEPPAPYQASQIDVGSILLNGAVPVSPAYPAKLEDHDARLKAKFDRAAVLPTLIAGDHVPVTVAGRIAGSDFRGATEIRVKPLKMHAPAAGSALAAGDIATLIWDQPEPPLPPSATLLISFDGGGAWTVEADGIPCTGSYAWTVPDTVAGEVLLEVLWVYDTDETGAIAESEYAASGAFSIVAPTGVAERPAVLALRPAGPASGPLMVSFSLAGPSPASLDVYDVGGRRMVSREVGMRGPGWHTAVLGDLPPGLYLVRLSQAGESVRSRAVVLN